MKKIVTILGARPQFIKAAVLSRIISEHQEIEEIIVHTGQHYDSNMSDVFFDEMQIPKPKYFLNINGLNHGAMTGQMLEKIEKVLLDEKPDGVVVYGDTNSTLAGALAAQKIGVKVAHIEAGLRSFNMQMPEEVNRILTDRISGLLLCPTDTAIHNLDKEGFRHHPIKIVKTGDIMKDSVLFYGQLAQANSTILEQNSLIAGSFVLATIHRQENTEDIKVLKNIFEGLSKINEKEQVVIPLHPRTKAVLEKHKLQYPITFIAPVGYIDMQMLLSSCSTVITDSGGLQKEAFFHQKPSVIVRKETEWVELVTGGYAKIAGDESTNIFKVYEDLRNKKIDFSENLYGDEVGQDIYHQIKNFIA